MLRLQLFLLLRLLLRLLLQAPVVPLLCGLVSIAASAAAEKSFIVAAVLLLPSLMLLTVLLLLLLLLLAVHFDVGGDMHRRIQRHRKRNERFKEGQIILWLAQALLGLKHLHERHILHRGEFAGVYIVAAAVLLLSPCLAAVSVPFCPLLLRCHSASPSLPSFVSLYSLQLLLYLPALTCLFSGHLLLLQLPPLLLLLFLVCFLQTSSLRICF